MTPATPTLIGYFPKKRVARPEWLDGTPVGEGCSVSECFAAGPKGWIDHWLHNEWSCFPTVEVARSVVPEGKTDFQILAYALLPVRFENGKAHDLEISVVNVEPLPATFRFLGYDVVSRSSSDGFECSPLSCNSMAQEIAVNDFCLINDIELAVSAARRFSIEQPEPGDYFVVQVFREAGILFTEPPKPSDRRSNPSVDLVLPAGWLLLVVAGLLAWLAFSLTIAWARWIVGLAALGFVLAVVHAV